MQYLRSASLLHKVPLQIRDHYITLPQLLQTLQQQPNIMVLEIEKNPTSIFKQSVWIGNKTLGMSSWVSSLLPHLPFNQFYLYIDEASLEDRNSAEYLNEYFDKLFYKKYLGFCVSRRPDIDTSFLHNISSQNAFQVERKIHSQSKIALVDVRTRSQVRKDPVENLPTRQNFQYLNIPLNDDELTDQFHQKTKGLSDDWELITMCAKGYRSMISYSVFRHLGGRNWKLTTCRSPYREVNERLRQTRE